MPSDDTLLHRGVQKQFIRKLLPWYAKHGRHDMRWRKTKDPYAILLSEIMLQQTTVETVKPYFDRFLQRFPTVQELAEGDLNDVLALWSGLGYYARARNLWAAAQRIVSDFNGKIPADAAALETLPGIGAYTAGAVTAFAFNKPAPVLDANIIRVLMRLLAVDDDPKMRAVQDILRDVSLSLGKLSASGTAYSRLGGPRHLNLALMDLGAVVCLPQEPKCAGCPVAAFCLAKKYGRQGDIPLRADKFEKPVVRRIYAAIEKNGMWLVAQRPPNGLFGGLWEFFGTEIPVSVQPVLFLEKTVEKAIGLSVRVEQALPMFQHQLSHRTFVVRSFLCRWKSGRGPVPKKSIKSDYTHFRWVRPASLDRMGISAVTKKIIGYLFRPTIEP